MNVIFVVCFSVIGGFAVLMLACAMLGWKVDSECCEPIADRKAVAEGVFVKFCRDGESRLAESQRVDRSRELLAREALAGVLCESVPGLTPEALTEAWRDSVYDQTEA